MSTPINHQSGDPGAHDARAGAVPSADRTEIGVDPAVYERIERTTEFADLRRRFRGWVFPMAAAFLAWYFLYVLASGFARGFMGQRLIGNINVAFVFGLLQFVSTFVIAWLYERHMNRNVDPVADRIRHEIEGEAR